MASNEAVPAGTGLDTVNRLYDSLPDVFRSEDAKQFPAYPLRRWLTGVAVVMSMIETMIQRFDYIDPDDRSFVDLPDREAPYDYDDALPIGMTSDLVDPRSADPEWLQWLGCLVGINTRKFTGVQNIRDALANSDVNFKVGTKQMIVSVLKPYLSGTQRVAVYDHSTDGINGIGTGTIWDILVITKTSETPDDLDVTAVLNNLGVKPAGVVLHHHTYEASWAAIEATYPHWSDWNGKTWTQIEEAGLDNG